MQVKGWLPQSPECGTGVHTAMLVTDKSILLPLKYILAKFSSYGNLGYPSRNKGNWISYICINIQYLFFISDLLPSVWQTVGSSTSPQRTQFHSFLWLSNISLRIFTTSSLFIHLSTQGRKERVRQSGTDIDTLSRVKQILVGSCCYSAGSSASRSVMIERGGMAGVEGGPRGRGGVYTYGWFTLYRRNQHNIPQFLKN